MSCLGTWFSSRLGGVRFMVGLDDCESLCQPKQLYETIISLKAYTCHCITCKMYFKPLQAQIVLSIKKKKSDIATTYKYMSISGQDAKKQCVCQQVLSLVLVTRKFWVCVCFRTGQKGIRSHPLQHLLV